MIIWQVSNMRPFILQDCYIKNLCWKLSLAHLLLEVPFSRWKAKLSPANFNFKTNISRWKAFFYFWNKPFEKQFIYKKYHSITYVLTSQTSENLYMTLEITMLSPIKWKHLTELFQVLTLAPAGMETSLWGFQEPRWLSSLIH